MRRFSIVQSLVLVAFASACGGSGDSTAPNQTGNLVTNGSFRATIGGTAWSAAGRAVATQSGGLLTIAGASGTYAISFGIGPFTGPGTYSLVYAPSDNPPTVSQAIVVQGSQSWGTSVQGGTGSVVITAYTATRIAGSFSFDAPTASGAGGTLHVTNGSFDFTP